MDRLGDELLPGARLAQDQRRDVLPRDVGDQREHVDHLAVHAHDVLEVVLPERLIALHDRQRAHLLLQPLLLARVLDRLDGVRRKRVQERELALGEDLEGGAAVQVEHADRAGQARRSRARSWSGLRRGHRRALAALACASLACAALACAALACPPHERDADHRPDLLALDRLHAGELRLGEGVGREDGHAARDRLARDRLADRVVGRGRVHLPRDRELEGARARVHQEDLAALGVEHFAQAVEHVLEELAGVHHRREPRRQEEERLQRPGALVAGRRRGPRCRGTPGGGAGRLAGGRGPGVDDVDRELADTEPIAARDRRRSDLRPADDDARARREVDDLQTAARTPEDPGVVPGDGRIVDHQRVP
jgi:hypothetical protein